MARTTLAAAIRRVTPPWLQRTVGGRLMQSLAEQADELVDATVDGVALRLPGAIGTIDPAALALVGRERRIRRGPGEDATTYARRLRGWWDAHRTRGGPYALLGQLYAFFLDWLNVRMDVVYASGTRRWIDEAGVITRDAITWDADGSGRWALVWVFFHCPAEIPGADRTLITQDGDALITQGGDTLAAQQTIDLAGGLSSTEEAIFTAIPREWAAAHVAQMTVVLLFGTRRLWNYPQPVPTWAEWEASGALWGDEPVILIAE